MIHYANSGPPSKFFSFMCPRSLDIIYYRHNISTCRFTIQQMLFEPCPGGSVLKWYELEYSWTLLSVSKIATSIWNICNAAFEIIYRLKAGFPKPEYLYRVLFALLHCIVSPLGTSALYICIFAHPRLIIYFKHFLFLFFLFLLTIFHSR